MRTFLLIAGLAAALTACGEPELSTAEVEAAAKERVRESAGLSEDSTLFSNVFVGEAKTGEKVLCGTVRGSRAAGGEIPPVKFIASMERDEWVVFEPAKSLDLPSQPDKYVEWHTACLGERAVPAG